MIRSVQIFFRPDNEEAEAWAKDVRQWLADRYPKVKQTAKPDLVIALGGDGTILEAARKYQKTDAAILGLNIGTIGFLAAASTPSEFLPTLQKALENKFTVMERNMVEAKVMRTGKVVYQANALNDIAITSPINIVNLQILIDDHSYQFIRGSGVLISTATGSTAYNLSAAGPIVMPGLKCLVLTELLDHNLPTPSLVVEPSRTIRVVVEDFRSQKLLRLNNSSQAADVVIAADGSDVFPLEKSDEVIVQQSAKHSRFVVTNKNHFFTSLQDKFALK